MQREKIVIQTELDCGITNKYEYLIHVSIKLHFARRKKGKETNLFKKSEMITQSNIIHSIQKIKGIII